MRSAHNAATSARHVPSLDILSGRVLIAVSGFSAFGAYLLTLSPSLLGGDAGELQFVPPILSLAHPTGYPLHTLLGKLWTMVIPFGSVAVRMNLLSAVAGAVAVASVCAIVLTLTQSRSGALAAAAVLGLSDIFWDQAVQSDKYALNAMLLALVVLYLARFSRHPARRLRLVTAVVYGFSLTHHRSMLVIAPILAFMFLWLDGPLRRSPREITTTLVMAALPLLLYLYLPFGQSRDLPPGIWHPATLADWLDFLLDRNFVAEVQPWTGLAQKWAFYAETLLKQFGIPGVLLGLCGIVHQIIRRERMAVFLLAAFVSLAVLSAGYQVQRHWLFFIPSFVLFAIWIGAGVALVLRLVPSDAVARAVAAAAVLVLLVAPLLAANWPVRRSSHLDGGPIDLWRLELKRGYTAQRFVENGLPYVSPGAAIFADWEQATPLWYAQTVEQQRPDVAVIYPLEQLNVERINERPAYISRHYPTLAEPYRFSAAGSMIKVSLAPNFIAPKDMISTDLIWLDGGTPQLALIGYTVLPGKTPSIRAINLHFRALRKPDAAYAISVRLIDENNQQVWQEDRPAFAMNMFPTQRWKADEVVSDYFEIELPPGDSSKQFRLAIVLYAQTPTGFRNLTIANTSEMLGFVPGLLLSR